MTTTTTPQTYSDTEAFDKGQILEFPYPGPEHPPVGVVLDANPEAGLIQVARTDLKNVVPMAQRVYSQSRADAVGAPVLYSNPNSPDTVVEGQSTNALSHGRRAKSLQR